MEVQGDHSDHDPSSGETTVEGIDKQSKTRVSLSMNVLNKQDRLCRSSRSEEAVGAMRVSHSRIIARRVLSVSEA